MSLQPGTDPTPRDVDSMTVGDGEPHAGRVIPLADGLLVTSASTRGGESDALIRYDASGAEVARYEAGCTDVGDWVEVDGVWVVACSDTLLTIDPATRTAATSTSTQDIGRVAGLALSGTLAVERTGESGVVVTDPSGGLVSVIDTVNWTAVGSAPLEGTPQGIAIAGQTELQH